MMTHIPGFKRAAVFVFLRNGDHYLLLKRTKMPYLGVHAPIGGKIEAHETPHEAIARETFEETGLQPTCFRFCGLLTETSPIDYNWISYVYVADIDYIDPPLSDEGTLHWIHKDRLSTVTIPPTDGPILKFIDENRIFILNAIFDSKMHLLEMTEELQKERIL
ncbi:MAG: NUDIX domain-containing protein [Saprospiraceae bacterium]|nr:MAG: NUDIX hydrolase [Bacteroidetes bacterium OLB9]MCO6463936.1 NUDIX domain-containing protein [Saprospiraceae bacterium]